MKTAFSTLGCPKWSFNEILSTAIDLGFNGIEFRGVEKEIYTPKVKEFLKENIADTKSRLENAVIEIPVFTSGAVLCQNGSGVLQEAYDYIDLCSNFKGSYIRVLADAAPYPQNDIDEALLVKNLVEVCGYAKDKDVNVCIETNGAYSKSDNILRLIDKVKCQNLFIIWDIHHTYRYGREKPKYTLSRIGGYVRHVHLKDSKLDGGKIVYKLLGDGDVPVKDAIYQLHKIGYKGYLCLEWVKRWAYELDEPGIAFPSFLFYVKDILKSL